MEIKKLIACITLALTGLSPMLFSIGWQVQQTLIRHEMQEELENTQVHTILLNPDEISWADRGKELWIDGRLFDVKEYYQNTNGTYTVKGLFDEEETALVEAVQRKMSQTNDQRLLGKLLQLQLASPESGGFFSLQTRSFQKLKYPAYNERLTEYCVQMVGPPPKA